MKNGGCHPPNWSLQLPSEEEIRNYLIENISENDLKEAKEESKK